jgi:hypothetical protein
MSQRTLATRLLPLFALGALSAALGASCSAGPGNNTTGSGAGSVGGSGATGSGGHSSTSSGTGADDIGFDGGTTSGSSSGTIDPDAGCAGQASKATLLPLDMFIMLDQSGSMTDPVAGGGNKWQAVTAALQAFVTQPGLTGVSVGIQYFGLPPSGACPTTCTSDAQCGNYGPCDSFFGCLGCAFGGDSCDPNDYAQADVGIAPLPGNAAALISSLNAHSPATATPTSAALAGGIQFSKQWETAHPNHVTVHVFATDGDPTECDTTLSNIDGIAAAGANGAPSILTFVIGVGSSLTALNGIAAAGGTTSAFIVDTNQNTNQQFLMALNAIRGSALGCVYTIPKSDGGMVDLGKVNVQYTPGGGGPTEEFPRYDDQAHCPTSGDGWYFDNNQTPTQINLCPKTCDKVSKDSMGEVNIVLGCATKLPG